VGTVIPVPHVATYSGGFHALDQSSQSITVSNYVKSSRSVAEILLFFEFSRWLRPPSWIFEIAKFYWRLGYRGSRRIRMPNFVKISQSVVSILRFFHFSIWRPPSWIFEIVNFYLLSVSGGARRITVRNFVKICRSIVEILRFFEFSRWPPPPSRFFKSRNFIGDWGPEGGDASVCQIWSKSVNRLQRY